MVMFLDSYGIYNFQLLVVYLADSHRIACVKSVYKELVLEVSMEHQQQSVTMQELKPSAEGGGGAESSVCEMHPLWIISKLKALKITWYMIMWCTEE